MGNIFGMVSTLLANKNNVKLCNQAAIALIFPGQGTQSIGMSKELLASSRLARELFEEASEIIGFSLDKIASENGMNHWQSRPEVVQPLIVTHSIAAFNVKFPSLAAGSMMIGHSLGQYSALCASGSISFAQVIRLVHSRGLLMGRFVEKADREFILVALFAQTAFESLEFLKNFPFFCQLSSINSAKQIVVAIEMKNFEQLKAIANNFHCIKLNAQIPFHTSLMLDIVKEFEQELGAVAFKKPAFPVISNVTAVPIKAEEAKQDLLAHLHQPVRFHESLQCIIAMGIDKFCDIGPSKLFSRLLQRDYSSSFTEVSI